MRFPHRWDSIAYLAEGTPRQRAAYSALEETGVMRRLAPWNPVLAGTIPIGIDLPESDLDILCQVWEPEPFQSRCIAAFGRLSGFALQAKWVDGLPVTLVRFEAGGFPVEVFGQARPVLEQNGYRHMVVEARLLQLAGPGAVTAIRRLKADGLKTEPAFARYFGLEGDPYTTLLDLWGADETDLHRLVSGRRL